jgi:hypothetical protein
MSAIDNDREWLEAYRESQLKDEEFQAAVVRQFGSKNAGIMRYVGSKHNAATKAAADAYWESANRLVVMTEARRMSGASVRAYRDAHKAGQ